MGSGGLRVIIGTDPALHYDEGGGHLGAAKLVGNGIAYAGSKAGATGAYIDLSCAYWTDASPTPVPLLDGLSTFGAHQFVATPTSPEGGTDLCDGNVAIVAQSGPTSGVTDDDLSGWSCSVHEFFSTYPSDYSPLALATDSVIPQVYCANDVGSGTTPTLVCGSPYVLVSGSVAISSDISLSPPTGNAPAGTSWVVTATVVDSSKTGSPPVAGAKVTFSVDSGPDQGQTGTGTTDASGKTTFSIKNGGTLGTDGISASFVNGAGGTEKALADVTWVTASPTTTGAPTTTAGAVTG
jgi:hypothetical protein